MPSAEKATLGIYGEINLLFLSVELLRLARPLKIIGILGTLGSLWAIFKYPDFQKYLTTNKTKK